MSENPSPRIGAINYGLLVPLLLNTLMVQTVVSITRVTTSYRAVELELPVIWIGVISAAFAIVPLGIAVWVGRFIDRGNDALAAWIGASVLVAGGVLVAQSSDAMACFSAPRFWASGSCS